MHTQRFLEYSLEVREFLGLCESWGIRQFALGLRVAEFLPESGEDGRVSHDVVERRHHGNAGGIAAGYDVTDAGAHD